MTLATRIVTSIGIAALFIAALLVVAFVRTAHADTRQWIHENYPYCCDHRDCHQLNTKVRFDGNFYYFDWREREVRWNEKDAKTSPDSNFYVCQMYYDFEPRCFFRPAMGS